MRPLRNAIHAAAAAGLLLPWFGGCRAFEGAAQRATHACPIPADVAAAITSAAVRDELRAEPIARQCGAPATRRADGSFVVTFTRDAAGRWLPCADERLSVRWDSDAGAARVHRRALAGAELLRGFGRAATAEVTLTIEPDGDGCRVRADVPATCADQLLPLLTRTLTLAAGHERTAPGLAERNLAAWRSAQLVLCGRDARRERPAHTGELMWRAARLTGSGDVVHERLGDLATSHGDERRAQLHYRRALLLSADPRRRAALAARAAGAAQRLQQPTRLRSEAVDHLQSGELAAAETLLHSARRRTPAPTVDYLLLARVHRSRGDELGELAARLLSREHAPRPDAEPTVADRSWRRELRDYSRRLTLDRSPLLAARPPR